MSSKTPTNQKLNCHSTNMSQKKHLTKKLTRSYQALPSTTWGGATLALCRHMHSFFRTRRLKCKRVRFSNASKISKPRSSFYNYNSPQLIKLNALMEVKISCMRLMYQINKSFLVLYRYLNQIACQYCLSCQLHLKLTTQYISNKRLQLSFLFSNSQIAKRTMDLTTIQTCII